MNSVKKFLLYFLGASLLITQALSGQDICNAELVIHLLNAAQIVNFLKVPVYLKSNTPLNRNINDLPTFNWVATEPCLDIAVLPFYNQTTKMFFTDSNPFVRSYINLTSTDLLAALDTDIFRMFFNAAQIIPLFEEIKLQERRAGLYLRAASNYEDFTLQFSVPLYYLERNFFLSKDEIDAISLSPALNELAASSSQAEAQQLLIEHLVSDKMGLGDMRIHSLYTPYRSDFQKLSIGGFITLPTAHAFRQGIVGGSFCKNNCVPTLNLQKIVCGITGLEGISDQIRAKQKLIQTAFQVLDHLTANVADVSLGNNGHVTLAPMVRYEQRINDCISFWSQGSVQYVVPAEEDRFFIQAITEDEFKRNFNDPAQAEANLRFIENRITKTLFPKVVRVKVKPGPIVNLDAAFKWNYCFANALLGYDFWWQGRESFEFKTSLSPLLEVNKALNDPGLQHKLFGSLGFDIPFDSCMVHVGLRGDITVASSGVGKDFTLALDLQILF